MRRPAWRSFARACVREIDARAWVTSHHKGVVTDRVAFLQALDAFAARIDNREARLLAYLASVPTPWPRWPTAACCTRPARRCPGWALRSAAPSSSIWTKVAAGAVRWTRAVYALAGG